MKAAETLTVCDLKMMLRRCLLLICALSLPRSAASTDRSLRGRHLEVGSILALELINTETDEKVIDLFEGAVVDVESLGLSAPSFSVNAVTTDEGIGSVEFVLDNVKLNTENNAVYAMCGNSGLDFFKCNELGYGEYTIKAIPYSEINDEGEMGVAFEVTFSIVEKAPTETPTAFPTGTPTASPTVSPTGSPTESPTGTPMDSPTDSSYAIRINFGGTDYTDSLGRVWMADESTIGQAHRINCNDNPITGSLDDQLYCSNRWFNPWNSGEGPYKYDMPVDLDGEYIVRFHFAEIVSYSAVHHTLELVLS